MTPSLENIWNEFAEKLGQFIRSRVADPATAEDIRQNVFVKIHRRLDKLKDPAKLESWVYQIARNAVIDHYRTGKPTLEWTETMPVDNEVAAPELDELKAAFRRMIHGLPQPYREAVILTELEGWSQQQLALHLGMSLSGAKSRVQRGRAQLKQWLQECCTFEFDRYGKVIDCQARENQDCPECG